MPQNCNTIQPIAYNSILNMQVIKMLILVIVLFLICWGSRLSMEISIKVGLNTFSQEIYFLRIAINLLPYVHSCLNPFIYSLMSKNFRRSMWRRIHCCCCFCTGSYFCVRRRCFCQSNASTASTSATAAGLGGHESSDRSPGPCRHCRQFSSHYNLNDLSVANTSTYVNASLEPRSVSGCGSGNGSPGSSSGNRPMSRMRGLTTRLTIGSSASGGGSSPLLLMRNRAINNHSIYSTSVVPECTSHSEVDCCL